MRQFVTKAIVLNRTDFGEADRIISFITPDSGKVKALAKAARKSKSRLAGGIELFSETEITVIVGRGKINTLISSRIAKYYGNIVKDIEKTNTAYHLLKIIDKSTEDSPDSSYYQLLSSGLAALDDADLDPSLVRLWFEMQLLKNAGHQPNLKTDIMGKALKDAKSYSFHLDRMRFSSADKSQQSSYSANDIKFLRLGFSSTKPQLLARIDGSKKLISSLGPLVQAMLRQFVQI